MKYTFRCLNCQKSFIKLDSFQEIIIPLPTQKNNVLEFKQLLESYFMKETIEDYKCDFCGKKSTYEKETKISSIPDILIFVFNIFDVIDSCFVKKIQKNIEVPIYNLDLKNYEDKCEISSNQNKKYNLTSFICHYGNSVDFGHYIR